MKTTLALGVFIGFFICCVLVIVLAPNSAHEVINKIHGNSSSNSGSTVAPQDDSGGGVIPSDEKHESGEISQGTILPQPTDKKNGQGAMLPPSTDEPKRTKRMYVSDAPIEGASLPPRVFARRPLPVPTNESEMLDWLNMRNYKVEVEEQESYRISWQNLKKVSSKPTAIVVKRDGTVIPQYGSHTVASRGGIVSVGDNNTSTVVSAGNSTSTNTNNEMTTTASIKSENGSWCIETIRSFVWDPSRDSIDDVLSKAKKIKEMNDEN